ncbi:MAG: glycoside hydrolase, partial [Planctomycetes bacterium]|nr:glycoside hydrolase [Planctomycetota bacterium]
EKDDKPKPVNITPGAALGEPASPANAAIEPVVVYDGTRTHLVYCQNDGTANHNVVYTQRVGAGPYATPAPLFPGSTNDSRRPHAAMDAAGTLHVVWVEGTAPNRDIFYATRSSTGVISTATNLSNTPGGDENNPRIHADVAGRLHVVWEGTSGLTSAIFYRRTVGSIFTAAQVLPFSTSGISGEMPDVGADSDQHVYVVWAESVGPNRVVRMMRSDDNGATFNNVGAGIAVGGTADKSEPRIACGGLGDVVLTFVAQNTAGDRALFVTFTRTGGTFANPGTLFTSTTGGVRSPAIARFKQTSGEQCVMIACNDGPAGGGNILVFASRDGGANWPNNPVDMSAGNSQPATNRTPAIAMDDNEVIVAWAAQPTGGGVVRTYTSASTYTLP